MVGILLASLALMVAGASGDQASAPAPAGLGATADGRSRLFISPMGEPFRSDRDPQDLWFDQADANHDGALSLAEFKRDAARFFALLDRNHDGAIDPEDIDYYESELVPEIRVEADEGDGPDTDSGDGGEGGSHSHAGHAKLGAARFSYFDFPEPVMVADTNFDRGVDEREFQRAAEARFAMLDQNGDGMIQRAELPKISAAAGRSERKGKHRR
ncbi:MAG: EF-hand domain-containing protein [Pseudomonadota bacterium]